MKNIVRLSILALVLFAVVVACPTRDPWNGKSAPAIEGSDTSGRSWSLARQTGKVVLVDFWATWCGPCIQELPRMKRIYDRFKADERFSMVGISLDTDPAIVARFAQARGLGWPMLVEPGRMWDNSIVQEWGVHFIPMTVLIDPQGNVVASQLRGAELEERLASMLGETR